MGACMKRHLLVLAAGVPLITAIDCYHYFSAQQAVTPAPARNCVADALAGIPQVAQVKNQRRTSGMEYFGVALNDSTAKGHRRDVSIWHRTDPTGDQDTLWASTTWSLLKGPSPTEKQSVATLAARVLTHLQERCAPGAPSRVTCELDGRSLPCSAAG